MQYGAVLTLGKLGIVFHLQVPPHDGPIEIGRQGSWGSGSAHSAGKQHCDLEDFLLTCARTKNHIHIQMRMHIHIS